MGMKRRTLNRNHFVISQVLEESAHTLPEDNTDNISPCSKHTKIASTSSSKRSSRRVIEKRVVSVPINDVGRLRMKGDQISAPPSDSWAWRKYGQKPIKGSPHPRGYYRCSSSKGCPARKQVERSRLDPNMLLVTYSCEHNHPWPPSRNHNHRAGVPAAATTTTTSVSEEEVEVEDENDEGEGEGEEEEEEEKKPISTHHHELIFEDKFSNIDEEAPPPAPPLINGGEFGWLTDFEYSTSCTVLESPILEEERIITTDDNEMAMIFTTREEDESLFGDLGELPECSMVFRRGMAQREVEHRRHSFATTG